MMSILIKDRKMPENCLECFCLNDEYFYCQVVGRKPSDENITTTRPDWCPLIEIQPHGRLIDADALRSRMYHEAFETDTPMQKWDSGCWIRYKMFEQMEESAPTIIPAEEGE